MVLKGQSSSLSELTNRLRYTTCESKTKTKNTRNVVWDTFDPNLQLVKSEIQNKYLASFQQVDIAPNIQCMVTGFLIEQGMDNSVLGNTCSEFPAVQFVSKSCKREFWRISASGEMLIVVRLNRVKECWLREKVCLKTQKI